MGIQRYRVKGEWVDEPFVTFGHAEMVLYSDHIEREKVLREALKIADDMLRDEGYTTDEATNPRELAKMRKIEAALRTVEDSNGD